MTLFEKCLIAHLIADWFLQNEWMALNKTSLRHPAAYVHSGIHLLAMLFILPWPLALFVAVTHLLIDTRAPLQEWRKLYRQTTEGPIMPVFGMWQDQVAHILILALVVTLR